jgi:hypothetical protein
MTSVQHHRAGHKRHRTVHKTHATLRSSIKKNCPRNKQGLVRNEDADPTPKVSADAIHSLQTNAPCRQNASTNCHASCQNKIPNSRGIRRERTSPEVKFRRVKKNKTARISKRNLSLNSHRKSQGRLANTRCQKQRQDHTK